MTDRLCVRVKCHAMSSREGQWRQKGIPSVSCDIQMASLTFVRDVTDSRQGAADKVD